MSLERAEIKSENVRSTEKAHDRLARIKDLGFYDFDDATWLVGLYEDLVGVLTGDGGLLANGGVPEEKRSLVRTLQRHGMLAPWDYYHHAPFCQANHYHEKRRVGWICTCGARAAGERYLSPEGESLAKKLDRAGILSIERKEWLLGMHRGEESSVAKLR